MPNSTHHVEGDEPPAAVDGLHQLHQVLPGAEVRVQRIEVPAIHPTPPKSPPPLSVDTRWTSLALRGSGFGEYGSGVSRPVIRCAGYVVWGGAGSPGPVAVVAVGHGGRHGRDEQCIHTCAHADTHPAVSPPRFRELPFVTLTQGLKVAEPTGDPAPAAPAVRVPGKGCARGDCSESSLLADGRVWVLYEACCTHQLGHSNREPSGRPKRSVMTL
jgi:hypothetical protein